MIGGLTQLYGLALPLAIRPVRHLLVREGDLYKPRRSLVAVTVLGCVAYGDLGRYS